MRMPRRAKRWATSLIAGALLLVAGGCGEEPTPDAAAPQLETVLSRVDGAIAARNWERARQLVQKLVSQTGVALDAGALTQEQANRIQAAAARLLSELPDPPPQSPSSPPALQSPSPPAAPGDPATTLDKTEGSEEEEKREEREDEAEERREEAEEHDNEQEDGD